MEHNKMHTVLLMQTTATPTAELPVIRRKHLKKGKLLGSGNFADVYKGRLALSRDQILRVAVKEPVNDADKLAWTAQEAWVLHELAGVEGVPQLYGVTDATPPALVMGLCEGALLQKLYESGEAGMCLRALLKLCGVVRRLHARGIAHGDIHAGNVMVDVSEEAEVEATLLDFGLAERYTDAARQMDDVNEVVTVALQLIPERRELSDVRDSLQCAADLDTVEDLLSDALRIVDALP